MGFRRAEPSYLEMPEERSVRKLTPTFSVVIPTYDRPRLLDRAVASVLGQHFGDFEVLVIDDASPRDPTSHLASLGDPRIRVIRRRHNGGAAAARNVGIEHARGRLVSFLDDDDEFLPTFLEETLCSLSDAPAAVGFCWTGVQVVEDTNDGEVVIEEGVWAPDHRERADAFRAFLLERRIGISCGVTVRSDALCAIGGFDESMSRAEDTDFLLRLARRYDYRVIPSTQVKVHHHPGPHLTSYDAEFARSYERMVVKHADAITADPEAWSAYRYKLGWLHYHGGDRRRGRRLLLSVVRRHPCHLKAWSVLILFEIFGLRAHSIHRRLSAYKRRLR